MFFVTEPVYAVFLSYASQDAPAARRITEGLRAAGIAVWFDQSDLLGGDTWDQSIRQHIHDCRLFVPVISAQTEARPEGYFRREWKLAVERTHDMSDRVAFLVPVVIDDTSDVKADVPGRFRQVQWTRLPAGETPPAFVEHVQRLLSPEPSSSAALSRAPAIGQSGVVTDIRAPVQLTWSSKRALPVAAVVLGVLAYLGIGKPWTLKPAVSSPTVAANPAPDAFSPPPHSIAVLPFVNMTKEADQQYFSDGLTEEVLNSLAEVNGLQVAARTSSFSFQGEHPDIATVAHKLNVGSVLEGSVRRSGHTVRITAQLINAITGFHLWSKTYDRDLSDMLKLQTEIATAVASALKVTLLGDEGAKIELGGTHNPAAFDAYLRGRKIQLTLQSGKDAQSAIRTFTEAIALDPNYALAFANRSRSFTSYASESPGPDARKAFERALQDARKAIALTPDLADGHVALAEYFESGALDFTTANEEYARARALAPGNAEVLRLYGRFSAGLGRAEAGITAAQRAVILDPLYMRAHTWLGFTLFYARRYDQAVVAFQDALALDPEFPISHAFRGLTYVLLGDLERARASCERRPDDAYIDVCLAVAYDKLGQHANAEAYLAKLKASAGDSAAYQYGEIYAQWGNIPKGLESLETALRVRDPGLADIKGDPLLDPLRNESRFQAVEHALKIPQ